MKRRELLTGLSAAAGALNAQKMILDTKSYPSMGALVREDAAFDALVAEHGSPA